MVEPGAVVLSWPRLTDGQRSVAIKIFNGIQEIACDAAKASAAPAVERRPHHVFVIDGDRGAGKTSLLLTIHHLLSRLVEHETSTTCSNAGHNSPSRSLGLDGLEWRNPVGAFRSALVLPVVYPELEESEHALMEQVFASISTIMANQNERRAGSLRYDRRDDISAAGPDSDLRKQSEKLQEKLEDAWSGWIFGQRLGSEVLGRDSVDFRDYVQQRAKACSSGRNRQQAWRDFVDAFLDHMGCRLLVLCIDDSDLAPGVGYEVAQALRLYLSHLRIVTIVGVRFADLERNIVLTEIRQVAGQADYLIAQDQPTKDDRFPRPLQIFDPPNTRRNVPDARVVRDMRVVRVTYDRILQHVSEYLAKVMPPPFRHHLPTGVSDEELSKRVWNHDSLPESPPRDSDLDWPGLREPEAANGAQDGQLGLWLWRNRYRPTSRKFTLRDVSMLRLSLSQAGQSLAAGSWTPLERLCDLSSIQGDVELVRKAANIVSGEVRGTLSVAGDLWIVSHDFSDAQTTEIGLANDIVSFMVDLEVVRDHLWPGARVAVAKGAPDKNIKIGEFLTRRQSIHGHDFPINCIYACDARVARAGIPVERLGIQGKQWELPQAIAETTRIIDLIHIHNTVSWLVDPQPQLSDRIGAIFNVWCWSKGFDPESEAWRDAAPFRAAMADISRQSLPSSRDLLALLDQLRTIGNAKDASRTAALRRMSQALAVAHIPFDDGRSCKTAEFTDDPLAKLLATFADPPPEIPWRDRFLLALSVADQLQILVRWATSPDEIEGITRAVDGIRAFLVPPQTCPPSALDLVRYLRGWPRVIEMVTELAADLAVLASETIPAWAVAYDIVAADVRWLGLPPADVLELKRDYQSS